MAVYWPHGFGTRAMRGSTGVARNGNDGIVAHYYDVRLKYPHQTIAALAASSPVQAILSFDEFDQLVAQAAGPQCARALRDATEVVEKRLIDDKVCSSSLSLSLPPTACLKCCCVERHSRSFSM
jgi:hypothetical protein